MEYKHFSHPHNLIIRRVYELGQQVNCSGCNSPCDNTTTAVHACHQCNFFLHDHCANANRYVKHPCHKSHPLILLPYPTYAGNTFICNACGRPGKSFSYCCALCEFDLHVGCAFLPLAVTHQAHQHELGLFYGVSVVQRRGSNANHEYCNICKNVLEERHWAYCCKNKCDFNVHTACATTEVVQGLYHDDGGATQEQGSVANGGNVVEVELTEADLAALFDLKLQMMAQSMATMGNIK
ncbi:protein VACUOLELESS GAMETOPHYTES-like [Rutidosis leptorrhynchoides]|uniref:protein VACUOLELESS GAMETOPHYTES-like n=1 Tax=Rutidosis leptorrhynchoides TaxID=125765 RepID=UPI003A99E130